MEMLKGETLRTGDSYDVMKLSKVNIPCDEDHFMLHYAFGLPQVTHSTSSWHVESTVLDISALTEIRPYLVQSFTSTI